MSLPPPKVPTSSSVNASGGIKPADRPTEKPAAKPINDPWGESDPKALEVPGRGLFLDVMVGAAVRPEPAVAQTVPVAAMPNRALTDERSSDQRVLAAKEKFSLGDFSGTLELCLDVLKKQPSRADVIDLKRRAEESLQKMAESKLGDLKRIPHVAIDAGGVLWLNLDAKSAFLLSQIDGFVSYEELFMLSGMSRLETARILVQLRDEGVIK